MKSSSTEEESNPLILSDGETSDDLTQDIENSSPSNQNRSRTGVNYLHLIELIDTAVIENSTISNLPSLSDDDFDIENNNKPSFLRKSSSHLNLTECIVYIHPSLERVSHISATFLNSNFTSNYVAWTNINSSLMNSNIFSSNLQEHVRHHYSLLKDDPMHFITYSSPNKEKMGSLNSIRNDVLPNGNRIIFHYFGEALNSATFPNEFPLNSLFNLISPPSVFVFDCSNAGKVIDIFAKEAENHRNLRKQREEENKEYELKEAENDNSTEKSKLNKNKKKKKKKNSRLNRYSNSIGSSSSIASSINGTINWDDYFCLCATGVDQTMPENPMLPVDLFSSCLLTPVTLAILCHILQFYTTTFNDPGFPLSHLQTTLKYKNNCFFSNNSNSNNSNNTSSNINDNSNTNNNIKDNKDNGNNLEILLNALTDAIAADYLTAQTYQQLFKRDIVVCRLFERFVLFQFLLLPYSVVPVSYPKLPDMSRHALWQQWQMSMDSALNEIVVTSRSISNDFFFRAVQSFMAKQKANKLNELRLSVLSAVCQLPFYYTNPIIKPPKRHRKVSSLLFKSQNDENFQQQQQQMQQSLNVMSKKKRQIIEIEESLILSTMWSIIADFATKNETNRAKVALVINFPELFAKLLLLIKNSNYNYNNNSSSDNNKNNNNENSSLSNNKSNRTFIESLKNDEFNQSNSDGENNKENSNDKDMPQMSSKNSYWLCYIIAMILQRDPSIINYIRSDSDVLLLLNLTFNSKIPEKTRTLVLMILSYLAPNRPQLRDRLSQPDFMPLLKQLISSPTTKSSSNIINVSECECESGCSFSNSPRYLIWLFILMKRTFNVSSLDLSLFEKTGVHIQIAEYIHNKSFEVRAAALAALSVFIQSDTSSECNFNIMYLIFYVFNDVSYLVRYQLLCILIRYLNTFFYEESEIKYDFLNIKEVYMYIYKCNPLKMNFREFFIHLNTLNSDSASTSDSSLVELHSIKQICQLIVSFFTHDPHPSISRLATNYVEHNTYLPLPPFDTSAKSSEFDHIPMFADLQNYDESMSDHEALFAISSRKLIQSTDEQVEKENLICVKQRFTESFKDVKLYLNKRVNYGIPTCAAFAMDSKNIAIGFAKGVVAVYDTEFNEVSRIEISKCSGISQIRSWRNMFISSTNDGCIHMWNPNRNKCSEVFVSDISSLSSSSTIFSSSSLNNLNLNSNNNSHLNTNDLNLIKDVNNDSNDNCHLRNNSSSSFIFNNNVSGNFNSDFEQQNFVASNNNSSIIATSKGNHGLYMWDLLTKQLVSFYEVDGVVSSLFIHPNEVNICIVGYNDGKVTMYDTRAPQKIETMLSKNLKDPIVSICGNRNGSNLIYTMTNKGNMLIWDAFRNVTKSVSGFNRKVVSCDIHPSLPLIVFSESDDAPSIVKHDGSLLATFNLVDSNAITTFHPAKPIVAFTTRTGIVSTYKIQTASLD